MRDSCFFGCRTGLGGRKNQERDALSPRLRTGQSGLGCDKKYWGDVKKFLHYGGICDSILTVGSNGFVYGCDMRV